MKGFDAPSFLTGLLIGSFITLVILLIGRPADGASCPKGVLTGVVTHVRDGDTLEVEGIAIRLQGLAAPELSDPSGHAAADAMRQLTDGQVVRCELDGERTHDRCVAICYVGDQDLAELIVLAGLARDCPRFSGYRYRSAEFAAAGSGQTIAETYRLPHYCDR